MLAVWGCLKLKLGLVSQLMLPAAGLVQKQDFEAKKVRYTYMYISMLLFNMYFMC